MTRKDKIMPSFDLKKYSGQRFIKPDDVREQPLRDTVVGVTEGKFGKLELLLESGDIFSLNATNTGTLSKAYGNDSDALVGKVIELYLGQLRYNGADNDAVLVKPITPSTRKAKPAEPEQKPDFNDDVPF
jgi:hypothetical protein